jgi:hypothetical protein
MTFTSVGQYAYFFIVEKGPAAESTDAPQSRLIVQTYDEEEGKDY